jgi:hypothetical protein
METAPDRHCVSLSDNFGLSSTGSSALSTSLALNNASPVSPRTNIGVPTATSHCGWSRNNDRAFFIFASFAAIKCVEPSLPPTQRRLSCSMSYAVSKKYAAGLEMGFPGGALSQTEPGNLIVATWIPFAVVLAPHAVPTRDRWSPRHRRDVGSAFPRLPVGDTGRLHRRSL